MRMNDILSCLCVREKKKLLMNKIWTWLVNAMMIAHSIIHDLSKLLSFQFVDRDCDDK